MIVASYVAPTRERLLTYCFTTGVVVVVDCADGIVDAVLTDTLRRQVVSSDSRRTVRGNTRPDSSILT
jgi:hypothetical protein